MRGLNVTVAGQPRLGGGAENSCGRTFRPARGLALAFGDAKLGVLAVATLLMEWLLLVFLYRQKIVLRV